ncbi:hypothetical protein LIZ91_03010 [Enterococcus avium]|uniref:hypothetical protein n=1 Tax=Enterococcus avium TaxID=33945 RepID=UPI001D06AF29|nr:hypothetical protein [Enterococcus avium]MCB6915547.1 hypothetical protein [Enterococcus avium]MCQ4959581.1 hypothetical protein [Enterococcus avium]
MKSKHIVEFETEFEDKVNEFLSRKGIEIVSVNYQAYPLEQEHFTETAEYSALIFYKEIN